MVLLDEGKVLKRKIMTSKLLESAKKPHEKCVQRSEKRCRKGDRDVLKTLWLNWKLLLCWKVTEALKK